MTVFAHLCHYIHRHFSIQMRGIQPSHRLQKDLGLNEIEVLEVVVYLELVYEVTLPDSALVPALSVAQLCALIGQHADTEQSMALFQVYRNVKKTVSRRAN